MSPRTHTLPEKKQRQTDYQRRIRKSRELERAHGEEPKEPFLLLCSKERVGVCIYKYKS